MPLVTKPSLTLIHGWGCGSNIWEALLPHLAPYFETTLLDLPGYGGSPLSSQTWKEQDWLNTYASLIPENTLLCGWSLGGLVAMQLAAYHPEKVRHLITISTTPKFAASEDWPRGVSKESLDEMQSALRNNPQKLLKHFQGWMSTGEKDTKKILQVLRKKMLWNETATYLDALKISLEHLIAEDSRAVASQIKMPWLALQGSNDVLVAADALQTYPNVALVEIDNAGHAPMIGHAPFLAEQLINFGCKEIEYKQ